MTWLAIVLIAMTGINILISALLFRQLALFVMGTSSGAASSGLDIGTTLEPTELSDLSGATRQIPTPGVSQLMFFGSVDCGECTAIYPSLLELSRKADIEILHMIFGRDRAKARAYSEAVGLGGSAFFASPQVAARYDVDISPFAFAVGDDGVIYDKGLVNSQEQLERLISSAMDRRSNKELI